jgi:protein O-mannosyl-transferase
MNLALILITSFCTYIYCVWRNQFFVIDDQEGIVQYSGKRKDNSYYAWIKHFWWVMAEKNSRRHHWFSVLLQTACCGLLYLFLEPIVGSGVAFWATMLFAVHPINTQSVAWVSARGYPLGLFFLLIALQIPKIFSYYPILKTFPIVEYIVFSGVFIWAILGQFTTMCAFPVIFYLKQPSLGILSILLMIGMGLWFLHDIIKDRAKTFTEQAMEKGTKFNLRKPIVALKTLAYYTQLCLFPAHMGIYHKWGYHYDKDMEKEDSMFYLGFLLFIGLVWLFIVGNPIVRFGLIWYFSFLFIFLNWITIHQFVSERYCYIANIGLCIILANYLYPYPVVGAFILGLYLMRTWQHLPTYCEETRFYMSNIWNFPDSEVSMANLGVILMRAGLQGMAMDYWSAAIKINPDYDVPYYNLYSTQKLKGDFVNARKNLIGAINTPTCHFRDMWTKELANFDKELIQNKQKMAPWQFPQELQCKVIDGSGNVVMVTTGDTLVNPT